MPADKKDYNFQSLILTRGSNGKEKLLVISGSRGIYDDNGVKVGEVITAFADFHGSPEEVRQYLLK